MPAMTAGEIRHRGDRLRRRRTVLTAVSAAAAAAAVVAAVAIPSALIDRDEGRGPDPAQSPTSTVPPDAWRTIPLDANMSATNADGSDIAIQYDQDDIPEIRICDILIFPAGDAEHIARVDYLGADIVHTRILAQYSTPAEARRTMRTIRASGIPSCLYEDPDASGVALTWGPAYSAARNATVSGVYRNVDTDTPIGSAVAYTFAARGNALLVTRTSGTGGGARPGGVSLVKWAQQQDAPVLNAITRTYGK